MGILGLTGALRERGAFDQARHKTLAQVMAEARTRLLPEREGAGHDGKSEGDNNKGDDDAHAGAGDDLAASSGSALEDWELLLDMSDSADVLAKLSISEDNNNNSNNNNNNSNPGAASQADPDTFCASTYLTPSTFLVDKSSCAFQLWRRAERSIEGPVFPDAFPFTAMVSGLPRNISAAALRDLIEGELQCQLSTHFSFDLDEAIQRGPGYDDGTKMVFLQMASRAELIKLVHAARDRRADSALPDSALRPFVRVASPNVPRDERNAQRQREKEQRADHALHRTLTPEYEAYAREIREWCAGFHRAGATLIFYSDGPAAEKKDGEKKRRHWERVDETTRSLDHVAGRTALPRTDEGWFDGVQVGKMGAQGSEVFSGVLKELEASGLNVFQHACLGEADFELAHDGKHAAAVLSGDSDFFVTPDTVCIPLESVRHANGLVNSVVTICADDVVELLKVPKAHLSELSALCGNDVTKHLNEHIARVLQADEVTVERVSEFLCSSDWQAQLERAFEDCTDLPGLLRYSQRSIEQPREHVKELFLETAEALKEAVGAHQSAPRGLHRKPLRKAGKHLIQHVRSGKLCVAPLLAQAALNLETDHPVSQVMCLPLVCAEHMIGAPGLKGIRYEFSDSSGNAVKQELVFEERLPGFPRGLPLDKGDPQPEPFLGTVPPSPSKSGKTEADSAERRLARLLLIAQHSPSARSQLWPEKAGKAREKDNTRAQGVPAEQRLHPAVAGLAKQLLANTDGTSDPLNKLPRFASCIGSTSILAAIFTIMLSLDAADPLSDDDIDALVLTQAAVVAIRDEVGDETATSAIFSGIAEVLDFRRTAPERRSPARNGNGSPARDTHRPLRFRPRDGQERLRFAAVSSRYCEVLSKVKSLTQLLGLRDAAPRAFDRSSIRHVFHAPLFILIRGGLQRNERPYDIVKDILFFQRFYDAGPMRNAPWPKVARRVVEEAERTTTLIKEAFARKRR